MDVAELQVMLEGVALPATRQDLLRYAVRAGATVYEIGTLSGLPEGEYETIDDVAEELIRVQPELEDDTPATPREESGDPPGGEAYTQKRRPSGAMRAG